MIKSLLKDLKVEEFMKKSGRSYHVKYNPPHVAGKDDETGEDLVQRPDDKKEVIEKRLNTYHKFTKQVLDYYLNSGVLQKVNADQPIGKVSNDINNILW